MWVVFWMTNNNVDHFVICEDEEQAEAIYKQRIADEQVYCAGYAPIKKATEPHWYD